MRFFDDLAGNEALRRRVGTSILAGRFPHAVILEGEEGTGKRHFALRIAAALLCTGAAGANALPCGACANCRRTLAGQMPDVSVVTRGEKATLGVEAIREIRQDMYLSSTEAARKIYIIEEAHTMTAQAQNALLKVLEEPPTEVAILLLTERSEALLSTIRSRAQVLRMGLLSPDELDGWAETQPALAIIRRTRPGEWEEMKLACGGKAGVLSALSAKGQAAAAEKQKQAVLDVIRAVADRKGYAGVCDALKHLSPKRKELGEDLALLALAARDLCLAERDENVTLLCYRDRREVLGTVAALGGPRLHLLYDSVVRAMDDLAKNANVSLVTSTLAVALGT